MKSSLCFALALPVLLAAASARAGAPLGFPGAGGEPQLPDPELLSQLEESRVKWLEAKARSGGNYRYQVTTAGFIEFEFVTTITATADRVSKREYEEFYPPFFNIEPRNYVEEGGAIGTNSLGAPPRTVDELYEIAKSVLETTLEPYERLVFRLDQRGLLDACYYEDTRIADAVPRNGVRIANLTLLPRFPGATDSDSDSDSETVFARGSQGTAGVAKRVRLTRLKLALKKLKHIENPRLKRQERKRLRQRIRQLSKILD